MSCDWIWIWFFVTLIFRDVAAAKIIPFLPLLDSRKHPLSTEGHCSLELWNLERELRQTVHPFRVRGHWVSSHCEIRPGPSFILRDYQFYETGSFQIRQYFYEESDCSKPKMAFVAHGRLKHLTRSWLVGGAREASWELNEVYAIPYTQSAGKLITEKLRAHCRPEPHKQFPWPLLEQYRQLLIYKKYHHPEELTLDSGHLLSQNGETDEIDCTHALNFTVSELELLRMEEKQLPKTNFFIKEFFLGLPVWDPGANAMKLPAQFQEPLRNVKEIVDCKICKKVRESNQLSPPLLRPAKATPENEFPVHHLDGSWLSTVCESHANGIFVHRQLTFASSSLHWELRQRHYSDPLCRHPSYTFVAEGDFSVVEPSTTLFQTWNVVYKVKTAKLVPESRLTARNLRHAEHCGPSGMWRKGKTIDITDYGGCSALGIQVPAITKDILSLSVRKNSFLFTGDYVTSELSAETTPTSFRPPMSKCEEMTVVVSLIAEDNIQDNRGKYLMWTSTSERKNVNLYLFVSSCIIGMILLYL